MREVLFADEIPDGIVSGVEVPARGVEGVAGAHGPGEERSLVGGLHVVEGDQFRLLLVLILVSGAERSGEGPGEEAGPEVDMGLVFVLLDLAERLGQLVELDEVRRVEIHERGVGRREARFAFVGEVDIEADRVLLVAFQTDVPLVGTLLRGAGVVEAPLDAEPAEVMLSREGDVGGLLAFEACGFRVGRSAFGLAAQVGRGRTVRLGRDVLVGQAVAILPVVAAVVHAAEFDLVILVEFPVERERVALALAVHVVLPDLELVDISVAGLVLLPGGLDVVRTDRVVVVGERRHDAQPVLEEARAPTCRSVEGDTLRNGVVADSGRSGSGLAIG